MLSCHKCARPPSLMPAQWIGSCLASIEFFSRFSGFPESLQTNTSKFQFVHDGNLHENRLLGCSGILSLNVVISVFVIFILLQLQSVYNYKCYYKDVRANCFCTSLLRTQIHMPCHASSTRAKY